LSVHPDFLKIKGGTLIMFPETKKKKLTIIQASGKKKILYCTYPINKYNTLKDFKLQILMINVSKKINNAGGQFDHNLTT
jgi:hypothetical protein